MANPITTLKNTPSNNTNLKVWLSVCLLLLSFIPGFYYMRIGVDFCDESYQIINACDYLNTPLAPLTAYASHWLTGFTVNILDFRYFSFFLIYGSILCAGGFLYSRTKNISVSLIVTAAAIFMTGLSEYKGWLYGWDSFSYCSMTLVCIAVLSYILNTNLKWLIITAFLAAIATLCRVPNIVCIFIIGGGNIYNTALPKERIL